MSAKFQGMTIIDSSNAHLIADVPEGVMRGYEARDYEAHPYGSLEFAAPRKRKTYPRSEWPERLAARKAAGVNMVELHKRYKLKVKNQQRTNFCWMNGTVKAFELKRAFMNLPYVELSSASAACKITNYQNVGGWGGQALKGIKSTGIVPVELWPANAIDRQYDTQHSREVAKLYKASEWDELRQRSFDELFSALLDLDICPVGHIWWGHLVCHLEPVQLGRNDFGTIFVNSWGEDWEEGGFAVMHEEKATPDEANALRIVDASVPA